MDRQIAGLPSRFICRLGSPVGRRYCHPLRPFGEHSRQNLFNHRDDGRLRVITTVQQMIDERLQSAETLMAMGRLQERLETGQEREREDFFRRFEKFSAPGNRKRFRRLFKQQESAER